MKGGFFRQREINDRGHSLRDLTKQARSQVAVFKSELPQYEKKKHERAAQAAEAARADESA
jgi:hypothetical protein